MPQSTTLLKKTETFTADGDVTIANCGNAPLHVLTPEEIADVDALDLNIRNQVMKAMYSIEPGSRRTVKQGTYNVILGVNGMAFLSYKCRVKIAPVESKPTA